MSIQPDKFTVADVMIKAEGVPQTAPTTLLKEALEEMDAKRLGIICIVDTECRLCGLITDGDIRRMLTRVQKPFAALMSDDVINHAMTNPTTVTKDMSLRKLSRSWVRNRSGICRLSAMMAFLKDCCTSTLR